MGKIDAIVSEDTIIEIKTSGKSPVQQEIDSNIQLTLYSWAFRMLFGSDERNYQGYISSEDKGTKDCGNGDSENKERSFVVTRYYCSGDPWY